MTDAMFNDGLAFAAVQIMDHGSYVAMNGTIPLGKSVIKNKEVNQFGRI